MPLDPTPLSWLAVVTLGLAVLALLISLAAWRRAGRFPTSPARRPHRPLLTTRRGSRTPPTTEEVAAQLETLRIDAASSLRHLAVVRYDAFGDMGGHLSWSMALLDDGGDGVVLTAIHGRSDSRTYAKNVTGWTANQQLSPEEVEAIGFARTSA